MNLTIGAALAKFFTKVLGHNARAVGIATLSRMIARRKIVDVVG